MASAPADRHMSGANARTASICGMGSVIPMTRPTARVPIRLTIARRTTEYLADHNGIADTGEIIISWVKSVKWSSTSEVMPVVVVINSILTSMPISINSP